VPPPANDALAERWLLADVGGTNTRLGLAEAGALIEDSLRIMPNARFGGLGPLLRHYLEDWQDAPVTRLCAGVAGPVRSGRAKLTNHDWIIDSAALAHATGAAHVRLINDIQAQGYALDDLDEAQITVLFEGAVPPAEAARLVMGIGTGSNVAVIHRTDSGLFVPPAESGHATLPFVTGELGALIDHLGTVQHHRPIESALSGQGLQNIWCWLGGGPESADRIVTLAHAGEPRAVRALELFSRLLGHVSGDIALAHLPMGGIFLFGGVARAIAPFLERSGFHAAFIAKGPYRAILQEIPIGLICDDSAALRGCARLLRQEAAP
jgi:glucokinase